MTKEEKTTRRGKNIEEADVLYNGIRGSRVSWRKKASYRKPIKRRVSKIRRRELKTLLNEQIQRDTQAVKEASLLN